MIALSDEDEQVQQVCRSTLEEFKNFQKKNWIITGRIEIGEARCPEKGRKKRTTEKKSGDIDRRKNGGRKRQSK